VSPVPLSHPQSDQLEAFAAGQIAPEAAVEISAHLASCEACRTVIDSLPADTLVSLLRQVPVPAELPTTTAPPAVDIHDVVTRAWPSAPPSNEFPIPAALTDNPRYRVIELVGIGGMGAVYKAEHRLMERHVALKVVNPSLVNKPAMVERFQREVKAAARLTHPNIVTAHDADQAGETHFLVMEYVEGVSLNQHVQKHGALPVAEACAYIRQAALGLAHAAERGMVHRDIKPHNLMLTADGQVKILDFGLARFVREQAGAETDGVASGESDASNSGKKPPITEIGAVMGTVDFIAPEQAADPRQADLRADIYSLGCTLYYLLAGQAPYPEGSTLDKLTAHLERDPKPLSEFRSDVPTRLAGVIARMMAKDPARRYQTPAAVAEALQPFAARKAPPRGRRWAMAFAACLLGGAILAGTIIYVQTDKGILEIKAQDDAIHVVIDQMGVMIRDRESKRAYRMKVGEHKLASGDYEIDVTELPEGVEFKTDQFTIRRGGAVRLTANSRRSRDSTGTAARAKTRPPAPGEGIPAQYRPAIDKGLGYLAKMQKKDGHWEADGGQYPHAITAMAGMVMLMEGSTLDDGKYADSIRRAVDWLSGRSQPNGMIGTPKVEARYLFGHGYAMLFLASVYGQTENGPRRSKLEEILTKAVEFTANAQSKHGGWGYVAAREGDNFDESASTIIQLQGLRAARNAGIVVPKRLIDLDYLRRTTTPRGAVMYSITQPQGGGDRPALTAAALACMFTTGEYDSELGKKWLVFCQQLVPIDKPKSGLGWDEFTQYYYAQALYILGESGYVKLFPHSNAAEQLTWSKYRAATFGAVVAQQGDDGSWKSVLGPVYATTCWLTVLQLDQGMVPIYQR
jgi:hypothetical protein